MVTCPNCGNQQEGAAKCNRCSTLFAYYTPVQLKQSDALASPGPNQATQHTPAATPAPLNAVSAPTLFTRIRTVYRAASWVALGIAIILFALVFHKSPPPLVAATPEAAHRAEEKIRASEADDKLGVPHRLQLDGEELNSFLNQNLAINGRTQPAMPDPATAIPPAGTVAADSTPAVAPRLPQFDTGSPAPTLEEVQSAVKDVRVDLVGDLVKAYVIFNFHGADLSLELDGHLRAENGYLHFDPVSGTLGSLPLPQSTLQSAAEHLFDSPENKEKMKLPNNVSGIEVSNGQLVFDYNDH
ncbi:MAG TPA: hypothetical protein VN862_00790 [Candidatus Acidoferrales bacterium]|nr:hypothetical protein [Candidatus Acidoferrales bacterium]